MTSEATPWQRDGRTVYALQAEPYGFHKGVPQYRNRFSAHIQDALTPDVELERIARLIAAAPDLLASVKELVEWHARREGEGTEDALLPPEQQEVEMWRAMDAIAKAEPRS